MWQQIIDFPEYEVSDEGKVRRCKNQRELKPSTAGAGYQRVNLRREGQTVQKYIHRLVAEAYLEKPEGAYEVNHKDGDKTNNAVDNLEWVSHQQNVQHSFDQLNRTKSKTGIKVTFLTGEIKIFETVKECADFYRVDPKTIRDYCDHALRPSRKIQAHFERL